MCTSTVQSQCIVLQVLLVMSSYIIKISDDLVEQSEPLHSLLVDVSLIVEAPEVRDGGKYHTRTLAALRVELLRTMHNTQGCVYIHVLMYMLMGDAEGRNKEANTVIQTTALYGPTTPG